jgi:hypothetical protein
MLEDAYFGEEIHWTRDIGAANQAGKGLECSASK